MPPRIFISYRRDDAAGDAGRLADHLNRRFGKGQVFLDIDTIDPGTDFVRVLHDSLQETAAVLVVIGQRWTSVQGTGGTRRLDDANDFVRLEVEAALSRTILVVPVLVQGAPMPRAADLPASLASLATRQAFTLDHAEFHEDADRLCDRLAAAIAIHGSTRSILQRWWPAAAIAVLILGGATYFGMRPASEVTSRGLNSTTTAGTASSPATGTTGSADGPGHVTGTFGPDDAAKAKRAEELAGEAAAQRRRNQFADALVTLGQARDLAPASASIRAAQEDAAMELIRNARVENEKSSFGDVIKPALTVVDTALPSATGARRADLLAHTGWATFLLWRDGDRRLNPSDTYREALSIDPGNPYANAMLAHWILFQDHDQLSDAAKLFDTALKEGRAHDTIRTLQWAAYGNSNEPEAAAERVRLANAMRVAGEKLNARQQQTFWAPYYFATPPSREKDRQVLLAAVSPDDHIATLGWAFDEVAAKDDSRRQSIRYYVALLNAKAGRTDQAATDLRALLKELAQEQASGSLRDGVEAALAQLQPGRAGRQSR